MGQSKADKKTQTDLVARDTAAEAQKQQFLTSAQTKSPMEQAVENSRLKDINYFNQATPDYSQLPAGMIDPTLFSRAALGRLQERKGTGGAQMGAFGADPNLLALSRENTAAHSAENNAGALAGQLAGRRAEAFGGADASINLNVQRALSLAGMGSSNANAAQQARVNFRPAPSFWSSLALAGVQGATGIASSYVTGGLSAAKPKTPAAPPIAYSLPAPGYWPNG